MFTGIVEATGTIHSIKDNLFCIEHPFGKPFTKGESLALSGMCATVLESNTRTFTVEIMSESRTRTTFGTAKIGESVNLERSAIIGTRNSGHNVSGHIDECGKIITCEQKDDFHLLRVKINPKHARWIVEKGSIALDGISLTIMGCGKDFLEVGIISHTWDNTNLHMKKVGDSVNIEYDIFAKYVENLSK